MMLQEHRTPRQAHARKEYTISQRSEKRSNKAKSIIAQPLFRSRQERAKKGKGSYRRDKQASRSNHPEAFLFLAA